MILHISSIIVQVNSLAWSSVYDSIEKQEHASISASDEGQGKMIVVLEAPSLHDTQNMIDALKAIKGVVSATMVYHHSEPASELNQPLYEHAS
ncbi:chaperone NapD [Marinagarivorans cellulosilyticus]|uniref:Chaperone NapD n=1 Tax=Marinagarivorans cellulosilyticus TaxID=2721545 RepID=A0AAN2BLG5_9GAMM|nr:chaperone NapD [Marinagarivorans cellulosilyticus]BCD99064.1 periplasmic nitrate reductase NapD [Marinagarivorans cellulosilyticus]